MSGLSVIKRPTNAIPRWPFTINRETGQARQLALWYPMTESGMGNSLQDLGIGNGGASLPASLTVAPTWTSGEVYNTLALEFNGSSQYLSGTPTSRVSYQVTDPFSISAWVRVTGSGSRTLCSTAEFGTTSGWCIRYGDYGGGLSFFIGSSGAFRLVATNGTLNSQWHHVTVTNDGSDTNAGIVIYYDGVAQAPDVYGPSTAPGVISNGVWFVGRWTISGTPDQYWSGGIRDLRVYSRLLSAAEVWALYDPATRYELYQPVHARTYFKAAAANVTRTSDFNITIGAV